MNYFDRNEPWFDGDIVEFLNENKNNINRFEVVDDFFLIIHLNDGAYIKLEPEYGGIYFRHKKNLSDIGDKDIREYKQLMLDWIVDNTSREYDEVRLRFQEETERIDNLFKPYPQTVMSEDPSKWAELLAVSFGFLDDEEVGFVE